MKRRTRWLAGTVALLLGAGVVGVQQCRWEPAPVTAFSYAGHERPRVFISHHPLIPEPGSQLVVRLAPDLPGDASVSAAMATLANGDGAPIESRVCASSPDGAFNCAFTLPEGGRVLAYSGSLELSNGDTVRTRATYRFTVAAELPTDGLMEIRVPLNRTSGLADPYRVDTAWVRDPEGYEALAFVSDVEQNVFEGVLRDPAYRWRDDQLGFFLYTKAAFVTSYYSGRDTRCGKNPWPREPTFPAALAGIETLGVLHRKTTSSDGVEGRVTAPVGPDIFRDCAGQAVKQPGVGTFSATTDLPESALVAKHEFGHAAFGLGDEYTEPEETRRASPAPPFSPGDCCCVEDGGSGGSGIPDPSIDVGVRPRALGIETMRCVGADGSIQQTPLVGSPPACGENNAGIPDACFSAPDGGCPALAGDCVTASSWLGSGGPSGDTSRPNVFTSAEACAAAAAAAGEHPGVEDPARSLGTCRQVCGPSTAACPCGVTESWIVNRDPGTTATQAADAMGDASAASPLHGATCIWCVETTLCVRWQRALGEGAEDAWRTCEAPPKEATQLERWAQAITAAIGALLEPLLRIVRF
jgi:hypothetical protein